MDTDKKILQKKEILEQLPLTSLEFRILTYIKQGLTSLEIAQHNNCSARTIEKHRSNIIKKLHLSSGQNSLLIWTLSNPQYFNT
jgi:DNA-binding NarL/FixJ family response regulator